MHSSEVAHWTAKIQHLKAFEPNAANRAKVVKAQRARTQSRVEFWSAHRSMVEAGGDIATILDKTRRPASEDHMAKLKETFYNRVDAWEAEQRRVGAALVDAMVGRVLSTVKLTTLAAARRERKANLAELDKALEALQPPPPPPVAPAPAPAPAAPVVVVDPKAKALEAVRKLNREKALKTETLLAQRKRVIKGPRGRGEARRSRGGTGRAKGRGSR